MLNIYFEKTTTANIKKDFSPVVISFKCRNNNAHTQQTFTCSNSIIETVEKGVKNVKS